MTFLALGAKCGCLGASGLVNGTGSLPRNSDVRASEPSPTAQSRKKWRRVCWSRGSVMAASISSCGRFGGIVSEDGLENRENSSQVVDVMAVQIDRQRRVL